MQLLVCSLLYFLDSCSVFRFCVSPLSWLTWFHLTNIVIYLWLSPSFSTYLSVWFTVWLFQVICVVIFFVASLIHGFCHALSVFIKVLSSCHQALSPAFLECFTISSWHWKKNNPGILDSICQKENTFCVFIKEHCSHLRNIKTIIKA